MTVHALNTDTPDKSSVTLLHSLLKISIQNFYEVTHQVLSQAKTQSRKSSLPYCSYGLNLSLRFQILSNVYITSIEIVFKLSVAQTSPFFIMADHENIVKQLLNLPLTRSNLQCYGKTTFK